MQARSRRLVWPSSRIAAGVLLAAICSCIALVVFFWPDLAWARPGGGQSFSGGSKRPSGGSSSSGGGGDSGGILNLIIFLIFEAPIIGIPLFLIFVGYMIYSRMRASRTDWSTGEAGHTEASHVARSARKELDGLKSEDQNFSIVLFEDFLAFLYSQVHEARGRGAIDELGPYLTDPIRAQLQRPAGLVQVKGIVLGAMRFLDTQMGATHASVTIEFESNMTEVQQNGQEQAFYAVERWTLIRRRGAQSRTPDRARTITCPNCGAPRTALRGSRCTSCNTPVGDGAFDWTVSGLMLVSRETRPPLLTGTVEEKGTDFPTVVDPGANGGFAALQAKDPQVNWNNFLQRVGLVFNELQVAWSSQNLARARPFLSDAQFQSMMYWIETYRKSGLRNVTENAAIQNVMLARVTSDRFFDAVTIRLYATSLDYTLDGQGRVVAGNRSKMRPYSEYWTLVRGSARRGAARAEPVCPNCGAPLNVNMAGTCQYCNVIVTTGDFDWVVSRIEQDEAYDG